MYDRLSTRRERDARWRERIDTIAFFVLAVFGFVVMIGTWGWLILLWGVE